MKLLMSNIYIQVHFMVSEINGPTHSTIYNYYNTSTGIRCNMVEELIRKNVESIR
jgi:hypothetical protein